jgi:hypothetical protein
MVGIFSGRLKVITGAISARAVTVGKIFTDLKSFTYSLVAVSYGIALLKYGDISNVTGSLNDSFAVLYSEVFNTKHIKHQYFERAKFLYATRLGKTELDRQDLKKMFLEMKVVSCTDTNSSEEDIGWTELINFNRRDGRDSADLSAKVHVSTGEPFSYTNYSSNNFNLEGLVDRNGVKYSDVIVKDINYKVAKSNVVSDVTL